MLPSGRVVNHSGFVLTHGWSGDACRARSKAISILFFLAIETKVSKSAMVPSAGFIASWPPSLLPIAHGTPGSVSVGVRVLLRPLRCEIPIG